MTRYIKIVTNDEAGDKEQGMAGASKKASSKSGLKSMKKKRLSKDFEVFQKRYFEGVKEEELSQFEAEIKWLFYGCENEYDLCHKMYPFYGGSIIKDIYSFMESTEQIQGNYELKEQEFGQLKHSLNVNDELALRLFHIIRFKIRSLTWKQISNYFKFLLKMKYNVQSAILKSKQAGDTPVSLDGIKMILKIRLNDEAKWLFGKVDDLHGAKVTWKQIKKYLTKIITVRDEMRDFFRDNARDRDFDDNHAEIINGIADNAEKILENNEGTQELLLETLKDIRKRLKHIERKIDAKDGGDEKKEEKKEVKDHINRLGVERAESKEKEPMLFKGSGSSQESIIHIPSKIKSNLSSDLMVPSKVATPVIQEEDESGIQEEEAEAEEAPNGGDE